MTEDEIMALAKEEYAEFCKLVEGMPYSEIDKFVNDNGLSYGTLAPEDNEGQVDINYKHLNITVANEEGVCYVSLIVEIYDDDDEEIDYDPIYAYPCWIMTEEEKNRLCVNKL